MATQRDKYPGGKELYQEHLMGQYNTGCERLLSIKRTRWVIHGLFVTLHTTVLLAAFAAMAGVELQGPAASVVRLTDQHRNVVAVFGAIISFFWMMNSHGYIWRTAVLLQVLSKMEKKGQLPARMFTAEWEVIKKVLGNWRRLMFRWEVFVPATYGALYIALPML